MTVSSKYRGWNIFCKSDLWFYSDNNESTINNERPCGRCMKKATEDGHDACLGNLPDIINACCGHGADDRVYIQFQNGNIIKDKQAIKWINKNK